MCDIITMLSDKGSLWVCVNTLANASRADTLDLGSVTTVVLFRIIPIG